MTLTRPSPDWLTSSGSRFDTCNERIRTCRSGESLWSSDIFPLSGTPVLLRAEVLLNCVKPINKQRTKTREVVCRVFAFSLPLHIMDLSPGTLCIRWRHPMGQLPFQKASIL